MAEERRQGHSELLEAFKEFKSDIKDDIKEIKDDIKGIKEEQKDIDSKIMAKVQSHVDINNKIYMNGFPPDKHVADHHIIDNIIEKLNDDKKAARTIMIEVLKVAAVAAATWIAVTLWNGFKTEVQPPFDSKPRIEQNVKNSR
jgi:hypothetical protein